MFFGACLCPFFFYFAETEHAIVYVVIALNFSAVVAVCFYYFREVVVYGVEFEVLLFAPVYCDV